MSSLSSVSFNLNVDQLNAVKKIHGNSLILAGAGTGKTHTLISKVIKTMESGASDREIMLLTFTNKAAFEMSRRVENYLKRPLFELTSGTFHSIASKLLRQYKRELGEDPLFSIMDLEDVKSLFEHIRKDMHITYKTFPKKNVLAFMLSYMRNKDLTLSDLLFQKYPDWMEFEDDLKEIFDRYQVLKKQSNIYDFDDLLENFLRLLKHEKTKEQILNQFKWIFIDEFQDTNKLQNDIVYEFSLRSSGLTVVGDDAQSIYSFRGACFQNILNFPDKYKDVSVFKLETNYRSSKEILDFANDVISHNIYQFPKVLVPYNSDTGLKPHIYRTYSDQDQADRVISLIEKRMENGQSLNHMAILYRAHSVSLSLQLALSREGIPFKVYSGIKFFEQAHIKDIMSFLKVIYNPVDISGWRRLLLMLPSVGIKSVTKITNLIVTKSFNPDLSSVSEIVHGLLSAKGKKYFTQVKNFFMDFLNNSSRPPSRLISELCKLTLLNDHIVSSYENFENRLEDIENLEDFAGKYEDIHSFLIEIALLAENRNSNKNKGVDSIILTTVHQAKGLEWETVFIVWMNEGFFPSYKSLENEEDIEEERRLFYVASTRAKKELIITLPSINLKARRGNIYLQPSRFLQELEEDLYSFENEVHEFD